MKKGIGFLLILGFVIGLLKVSYAEEKDGNRAAGSRSNQRMRGYSDLMQKDLENYFSDAVAKELIREKKIHTANDIQFLYMEKGDFSKTTSEERLAVFSVLNTPHTGGLDQRIMAVFSKEGKLLDYQALAGDDVAFYEFWHQDGTKYIMVSSISVYQGIEKQTLAMYHVNGSNFEEISMDCLELPDDSFVAFAGNDTLIYYKKPLSDRVEAPTYAYKDMKIYMILKWNGKGQFAEEYKDIKTACVLPDRQHTRCFYILCHCCFSASCIFIARTFNGSPNKVIKPSAS